MMDKLRLIGTLGGLTGSIYLISMCSVPRRGWMRVIERLCCGIAVCWLCQALLSPFGFSIPQSPLAALSAGYLGIPGAALASFLAYGQ